MEIEVVKVKASFPWAIRATIDGVCRYRGYRYKSNAVAGLPEWLTFSDSQFRAREFMHNFSSAEELGIKE